MEIVELVRATPGRHHAWYKTDLGTLVRKPLGQKLPRAHEMRWPSEKFVRGRAMAAFLPFIQIWNAYLYASAKERAIAKVGTFMTFIIPVIVLSAVVWAGGWAFVLFIAVRLFRS
jgi:hypothetical protein